MKNNVIKYAVTISPPQYELAAELEFRALFDTQVGKAAAEYLTDIIRESIVWICCDFGNDDGEIAPHDAGPVGQLFCEHGIDIRFSIIGIVREWVKDAGYGDPVMRAQLSALKEFVDQESARVEGESHDGTARTTQS